MTVRKVLSGAALLVAASSLDCGTSADGVQGTAIDTYDFPPTMTRKPISQATWSAVAAVSGGVSFPGTLDDQGNVSIPDVPMGPYQLSLSTPAPQLPGAQPLLSLIAETARTLDLGTKRTHRFGLQPMTKSSFMVLNASLTIPWQVYTDDGMGNVQPLDDHLQLFSRSTGVVGTYFASGADPSTHPPTDKAASLAGWSVDASAAIPYTDQGVSRYAAAQHDDVTFLHNVTVAVTEAAQPMGSPWASFTYDATQEVLTPPAVTLGDGGTVTIGGAFKAVPQKMFSFNYKGSAFNQAFADAPVAVPLYASVFMSVTMEPGAPTPGEGADANLLEVGVGSSPTYTNPACDPGACDMIMCTTGCGSGAQIVLPGDYARAFSYGNPFTYGQELFFVGLYFETDVTQLLADKTAERLQGFISVQMPAGAASGADIAPVVSLPREVTVGGKETALDSITASIGATPVVAFQAPSTGKADYYVVQAVQLDDQSDKAGTVLDRRIVLAIWTTDTSVKIPAGVLKSGKHYDFQVTAVASPGYDPSKPFAFRATEARAQTYTGVVTP